MGIPSGHHKNCQGKRLLLRVITYQVYAPDLPSHGQIRRLATTLLDPKHAPAKQLIAL